MSNMDTYVLQTSTQWTGNNSRPDVPTLRFNVGGVGIYLLFQPHLSHLVVVLLQFKVQLFGFLA